jgi:hypothetical protein
MLDGDRPDLATVGDRILAERTLVSRDEHSERLQVIVEGVRKQDRKHHECVPIPHFALDGETETGAALSGSAYLVKSDSD